MGMDRSLDDEGIPDLEGPLDAKVATGDPQEGVSPPSDHPASLGYGTTAEEEARGEPLSSRIAHELPDTIANADLYDEESDAPGVEGYSAEETAAHIEREGPEPDSWT
jgi:hypothetical protein